MKKELIQQQQQSLDYVDLFEEEKIVENQEEFERKYNFRFEDPDPEFIKSYPRTVVDSTRRKKIKRKELERLKKRRNKTYEKFKVNNNDNEDDKPVFTDDDEEDLKCNIYLIS